MAISDATDDHNAEEGTIEGANVTPASRGDDDVIKSLLSQTSTASKPTQQQEKRRQEYQDRLRSYQPETYFAKPCELSPIIAARFGWRNTEKDILTCDYCKSVVAVIFHPNLSRDASQRLTVWYESQLATSHSVACPCRKVAEGYYNKPAPSLTRSDKATVLNSSLASVFPSTEMELLELTQPTKQLIALIQKVTKCPGVTSASTAPPEISQYQSDIGGSPLSTRMLEALRRADEKLYDEMASGVEVSTIESSIMTVLFGWRLDEADNSLSRLSCPFCLASFATNNNSQSINSLGASTSDDDRRTNEPFQKRARVEKNPWDAHRHYCPVTCGFLQKGKIIAKPLWQNLADKYLSSVDGDSQSKDATTAGPGDEVEASPTASNNEPKPSAWMKIHQMLSLGIAGVKK